jgi:endoglucanase
MKTNRRHFGAVAACLVFFAAGSVFAFEWSLIAKSKKWPDEPLRGLCVGKPTLAITQEETFQRLAEWNINLITVNFAHDGRLADLPDTETLPEVPPAMEPYRGALDRLDRIVALANQYHIFIVLAGGGAVGIDEVNVMTGGVVEETEAAEREYLQNVIDLHLYLGEKYVNEPAILGYNFISEPHTPWIVEDWQTEVVPSFIQAVRTVDKNTFLIFSPGLWGFPVFDRLDAPFADPAGKTLYGFHFYAPHNYTHQGVGDRPVGLVYPGPLKMFDGSPLIEWNKQALYDYMKSACDFQEQHNVRIFVGEFSVIRWAPGRADWVSDVCDLFEENGFDWTYHSYTGWNGWNPTFSAEAAGSYEPDGGVETERLKILKTHWNKNSSFLEP